MSSRCPPPRRSNGRGLAGERPQSRRGEWMGPFSRLNPIRQPPPRAAHHPLLSLVHTPRLGIRPAHQATHPPKPPRTTSEQAESRLILNVPERTWTTPMAAPCARRSVMRAWALGIVGAARAWVALELLAPPWLLVWGVAESGATACLRGRSSGTGVERVSKHGIQSVFRVSENCRRWFGTGYAWPRQGNQMHGHQTSHRKKSGGRRRSKAQERTRRRVAIPPPTRIACGCPRAPSPTVELGGRVRAPTRACHAFDPGGQVKSGTCARRSIAQC